MRRKFAHPLGVGCGALLIAATVLWLGLQPLKAQSEAPSYSELLRIGNGTPDVAAWSPKGNLIAVGGSLGIQLYNDKLQRQSHLDFSTVAPGKTAGQIESIAWSHDGRRLAATAVGDASRIQVWDTTTNRPTASVTYSALDPFIGVWSPDDKRIATTGSPFVKIWDASTGKLVSNWEGHESYIVALAWSPDGRKLVSVDYVHSARVWDVASGKATAPFQVGKSSAVAWSPDGTQIAIDDNTTIQIWDAATLQPVKTLQGHTDIITRLAWSAGGLASASYDGTVRLWNVADAQTARTLQGGGSPVLDMQWSPDGHHILTVGADSTVRLWTADNGQVQSLQDYTSPLLSVSWRPDGSQFASAGYTALQVWNAKDGQFVRTLQTSTEPINAVAWSPDGSQIAAAGADETVRTWNTSTGQAVLNLTAHQAGATSIDWKGDGSQLASAGNDQLIKVWDITSGQLVRTLTGHAKAVTAVRWSPAGSQLASGSEDGSVKIWDAATGQLNSTLQIGAIVRSLAWNPGGQNLTVTHNTTVEVWSVATSQKVMTLEGDKTNAMNAVAWSPDGLKLLGGAADGTLYVWDVNTKHTDAAIKAFQDGVTSVAWNRGGNKLLSGSRDSAIKIYWITPTANTLKTKVGVCVTDSGLANSLNAKIEARQWSAFINEVQAQSDKQIDPQCASQLAEGATYLLTHPVPTSTPPSATP